MDRKQLMGRMTIKGCILAEAGGGVCECVYASGWRSVAVGAGAERMSGRETGGVGVIT